VWSAFVNTSIAVRKSDIRNAGVQHLNEISSGDALPLGHLQHFNDGAFYKLPVRLYGWVVLSNIIHCHLLQRSGSFVKQPPDGSEVLVSSHFQQDRHRMAPLF
jgi:hypothetical protein